ncbi:hypothetical protein EKQ25_06875 [Enterococcus faecalis]|uniref:hypothetical protein n=1 Tax=Enterococcus faecalis TaxID=1351 RepID=UPI0019FC0766|nr:hypothetical protein [Enterococcus faecalis]
MRYGVKIDLNISKELKFNDGTRIVYKLFKIENGYQMSIEETTNKYFPDSIKTGESIVFDSIDDVFEFGDDLLYLIN